MDVIHVGLRFQGPDGTQTRDTGFESKDVLACGASDEPLALCLFRFLGHDCHLTLVTGGEL